MQFKYLTKELLLSSAELIDEGQEEYMCLAILEAAHRAGLIHANDINCKVKQEMEEILIANSISLHGYLESGKYYTDEQMRKYRVMFLLFAAEAYFGE